MAVWLGAAPCSSRLPMANRGSGLLSPVKRILILLAKASFTRNYPHKDPVSKYIHIEARLST